MRKFVPISKRIKKEKDVERPHAVKAKEAGYFVTKIEKTSTDGFPDRFYARCNEEDRCPNCGRGRIVLMEWKRDGKDPEPLQVERIRELREAGVEVYTVDNVKHANRILGIKR